MPNKKRCLVVCAVAQELSALQLPESIASFVCGVGPVEASHTLAAHLATQRYDCILNVGIAGGFTPQIDVGSSVIVTDEYYSDIGREDGIEIALPDNASLISTIQLSCSAFPHLSSCSAIFGKAVTSATVTTSSARAQLLQTRFPNLFSESMEGFAIARTAAATATPILQIRGISNRVGERSAAGWNFQAGIAAAAKLTHEVLERLW